MGPITHVLFDLDGTLIDSLPGIEWSAGIALAECGLDADLRDLRRRIGPPISDILAAISGATGDLVDRLETAFRRHYDIDGWRRTELRPGVLDLLLDLQSAGRRLWVVTNKPSMSTGRILRELNIEGLFEHFLCRDSRVPSFTSKAEMLRELMACHDITPSNSFLVGDTLEDCRAAAGAGLRCFLVPDGYGNGLSAIDSIHCSLVNGWDEIRNACETGEWFNPLPPARLSMTLAEPDAKEDRKSL